MLPATQFTHHWAENTSTNGLVVLSHQNSGIAVEANNRTIGTPHVLGGADDNGAVHIALFHAAPRRSFLHRDRKSVVEGKSVSVRVDLGGRRIIKKTIYMTINPHLTDTSKRD